MSQGPLPMRLGADASAAARGLWGMALRNEMAKYNHMAGLKIVGEMLPQERNRVDAGRRDRRVRAAHPARHLFLCDNDKRLLRARAPLHERRRWRRPAARDIWTQTRTPPSERHLPHGRRSRATASSTPTAAAGTSRNLWICDGSVFPTVGGVNPSLTIQAHRLPHRRPHPRAWARRGEL